MSDPTASDYRLAPAFAARFVGVGFVLTAVFVFATTVVGVLAGWPLAAVLAVAGLGLAAMLVVAVRLRSTVVVHFDETGYRVRLVRGVGAATGRWSEVDDAVTADVGGEPCLMLRLSSGASSTIPLRVVAAAPDVFVTDLRGRLQRGHGLRPIDS